MVKFNRYLVFYSVISAISLASCGPESSQSTQKEAWNIANEPMNISGAGIKRVWKALPRKGEAAQLGWSDDYWPSFKGGISYRWLTNEIGYPLLTGNEVNQVFEMQSPAEKYDLFMNRLDFPTVLTERKRTRVLETQKGFAEYNAEFKIPTWEGLCHGWAAAALNFKEPKKTIKYKLARGHAVEFYPSDIKALLLYYQQYSGNRIEVLTAFVGERCNASFAALQEKLDKGEITWEQYLAEHNSPQCSDMNAGSFHLLLANELGINKKGFVVDVTRDAEVWNQPINSFKSVVLAEKFGASVGAAASTVREIRIRTEMNYSIEVSPSREPSGVVENAKIYEYVLELNAASEIIGGHWLDDESDRPDFAWREGAPDFQGYFKRLKKVYQDALDE